MATHAAFVAVVCLPWLAMFVSVPFSLVQRWLDLRHDDDLPAPTGAWVDDRITALGLGGLEVGIAPASVGHVDALWPRADFIGLNPRTFYKRHPAWWAIGAHELGHAITHRSSHAVATTFVAARGWSRILDRLVAAALLGNLFLGSVTLTRIGLAALIAALVAHTVVLADETLATWHGWRLLRADDRLNRDHRFTAGISLVGAWSVYVASWAAHAAILVAWPWIAAHLAAVTPPGPADPLHWTSLFIAAALSAILIKRAARVAWHIARPVQVTREDEVLRIQRRESLGDLAGGLGAGAFVLLVWAQVPGPVWPLVVGLALVPALKPVGVLILAAVFQPISLVLREVDRLTARQALLLGHLPFQPPRPSPLQPVPAALRLQNDPPWQLRLEGLVRIAYIPAVVAWWLYFPVTLLAS